MLFLALPPVSTAPHIEHFAVDGVDRQALVFPGTGPVPKEGRPLVLAFHGHGGGSGQAARSFGIDALWPEATVVYPQGLPTSGMTDPEGTRNGWQQRRGENGDRDVRFVDAVLTRLKGYDPHRVYAMGHSNGGRFTYVLWAARGDRFAAYGPSGSPAIGLLREFKPAPAFCTAGESDPIVPYRGQKASIDALVRLDGIDLSRATKNGYVTLAPGKNGLELGTYIHPGGHEYPRAAAEATVAFFKRR